MGKMKKDDVIEALAKTGVPFDVNADYNDLYKLLKSKDVPVDPTKTEQPGNQSTSVIEEPTEIRIVSKMKKGNNYVNDAYRNERDQDALRAQIGRREYRGRIVMIVTTKYMEVDEDRNLVTIMVVHLK